MSSSRFIYPESLAPIAQELYEQAIEITERHNPPRARIKPHGEEASGSLYVPADNDPLAILRCSGEVGTRHSMGLDFARPADDGEVKAPELARLIIRSLEVKYHGNEKIVIENRHSTALLLGSHSLESSRELRRIHSSYHPDDPTQERLTTDNVTKRERLIGRESLLRVAGDDLLTDYSNWLRIHATEK